MARVNTALYGWSWGEFEFDWTTVGPFKVRIIPPNPPPNPNPNPDPITLTL